MWEHRAEEVARREEGMDAGRQGERETGKGERKKERELSRTCGCFQWSLVTHFLHPSPTLQ
jgi:hypothetical protein